MPRVSVEPLRRASLIEAAIAEIGHNGSLDVTVSQVAARAKVSSALAHHYFGSKEQLFLAAMREILRRYGADVRARLARTQTPMERLEAIIESSFDDCQFTPEVVSAWLAFYVEAQRSPGAARLLRLYVARLRSNLVHALTALVPRGQARTIAEEVAALIDGLYIRQALAPQMADKAGSKRMVEHTLLCLLGGGDLRAERLRHVAG
ncbi:MAG: transcriptional regulator BetI [Pseudomonadota bacterium]